MTESLIHDDHHHQVDVLLQALPYIQRFTGKVVVVKFGGNAMVDPELFGQFAQDIMLMHSVGIRPVVVHGGGPQIGYWLKRLGKSTAFVDGYRVTDQETLDVAQMVLVGKVNSSIVAALNVHGSLAVGLSGQDAGLIEAGQRHPELGFVGDVTGVNDSLVTKLLGMGLIPVISTIGSGADGQAYNINADDVASAIAESLHADKLMYLTDVAGVLRDVNDPQTLISRLSVEEAEKLKREGVISGGMIPKIDGCLRALDRGVGDVHLIDGRISHVLLLELFTDAGVGTMLSAR